MNEKKFLSLVLYVIFMLLKASGQSATDKSPSPYAQVSIASPNAASLGKYADIPVSYHTGIPDIDIPIYSLKDGPLELPISLSYHASGIKVMEPASWVGTGWTLNAGGVITRTVRGAPDEANTSNAQYGYFSNYGYSNYLTNNMLGGYPVSTGPAPNDNQFAAGIYDGEPDLYFFNFCGHTGKFYFNDDRTPVLVPGEDLKIDYYFPMDTAKTYTAASANIQGFTITTPDGVKYYFGNYPGGPVNGVSPVEMTFPYSNSHPYVTENVISSWFLSKITSADSLFTINLTYQPESYSYYTISMFPVNPPPPSTTEYELASDDIQGVRLTQISSSNGQVNFSPTSWARTDLGAYMCGFNEVVNTTAHALDNISINDSTGFCKKFSFHYSYFQDNSSTLPGYLSNYSLTTDTRHLRLDSLQEQTCDSIIRINPYKLNYATSFLPRRLSFGQDHWGFYNGIFNNTLIPTYSIDTFNFFPGADREPHWPAMQNGVLNKITYPLGGYDSLVYEPNRTHVSANEYNPVFQRSYYVGYDGNTSSTVTNVSFDGDHYQIILSNSTYQGSASIDIMNGSTSLAHLAAMPGTSDTAVFVFPAGTYTVQMYRGSAISGQGATANVTDVVPVNVQSDTIVGGLRIQSIFRNTGIAGQSPLVTNYSYLANGISSGILYGRPTYVQIIRNDILSTVGYSGNTTTTIPEIHGCIGPETLPNRQPFYISPCPLLPMNSTQGNHIGYNEVDVTQTGNGHSVYRFYGSNLWDMNQDNISYKNVNPEACLSSIPNVPSAPLPFDYNRGKLKYEAHYNEAGQLLKDVQYYYTFDSSTTTTPGYIVAYELGALLATKYELRAYWLGQTQTIASDYGQGTGQLQNITTHYFASPYHHQETRNVVNTSTTDSLSKNISYAPDFRIANCDTIADGWQTYTTACNACDARMYARIAANTRKDSQFVAYEDDFVCRAQARATYANYRKNAFTSPSSTYNTCMLQAYNAAGTELKPILELRNEFKYNPIEESQWRNQSLLGASFSRFDFASSPATKVYPNKTQLVNLSAPSTSFVSATSSANGTTIVKDSRYQDEQTYTFYNGNLTQTVPHDGQTASYIWDYHNREPIAKVLNASSTDIAFTSFEADGNGGWTFATSSIDATKGLSGTKSYALSTSNPISHSGLTASTTYVISYWTTNASAYSIAGTITGYPVQGSTVTIGSNNWTYFEHQITGQTSTQLSGTGNIDELRCYPVGAQMTTYTYSPLKGITSQSAVNGLTSYYEYDGLGRLLRVRDWNNNILKQYSYVYQWYAGNGADWHANGTLRCKPCPANSSYITNMQQHEEIDANPNSSTYNTARWVDDGIPGSCVITPDWENVGSPTCQTSGGNNTGYQVQQQQDMNPCSSTYGQTQNVVSSTQNLTACPTCSPSTCTAPVHKCISGACQTGTLEMISQTYSNGKCTKTYGYYFTDGSYQIDPTKTVSTTGPCEQ